MRYEDIGGIGGFPNILSTGKVIAMKKTYKNSKAIYEMPKKG